MQTSDYVIRPADHTLRRIPDRLSAAEAMAGAIPQRSIQYANLLTLPVRWIAAGILWVDVTLGAVVVAELLVAIAEGQYYRARMRHGGLTWSRAFIVSLAANAASVVIPFAFAFVPLLFEYG